MAARSSKGTGEGAGKTAGGGMSRRRALEHIGMGLGLAALTGGRGRSFRDGATASPQPADVTPSPAGRSAARRLLDGIDTFVVVMMENRSFDHLFGALRWDPAYPSRAVVDGLRGDEANRTPDGRVHRIHRLGCSATESPRHDWDALHAAWNDGRLDRFAAVNPGAQRDAVMGYHDRALLPLHYALADRYAVCDRWFASVMGPTWPNRFYLHAASAEGRRVNRPILDTRVPTVWERLADRGLEGKNYYAGNIPWFTAAFLGKALGANDAMVPARIEAFFADARRGALPNLSVIDPDFHVNDNHPPHSLALGEAFIASIVRALAESPQWSRSMLVLTYDEHGGFFDHVPPPTVPDPRPAFRRLGQRVPTVVVGPTVRAGAVVSTTFDHVSIAATLAARFGIASLGPRMDAAADLSACVDPERLGAPAVPPRDIGPVVLRRREHLEEPPRGSSQPDIDRLAAAGRIPADVVDRRDPRERLASWARAAQELEAVRVIG